MKKKGERVDTWPKQPFRRHSDFGGHSLSDGTVYEAAATIQHLVPKVATPMRGRPGMSISEGYKDIAKKALQNYLNNPLSDVDCNKLLVGSGWKPPTGTLGFIPLFKVMNDLNMRFTEKNT